MKHYKTIEYISAQFANEMVSRVESAIEDGFVLIWAGVNEENKYQRYEAILVREK